jgi:hypothetical protein
MALMKATRGRNTRHRNLFVLWNELCSFVPTQAEHRLTCTICILVIVQEYAAGSEVGTNMGDEAWGCYRVPMWVARSTQWQREGYELHAYGTHVPVDPPAEWHDSVKAMNWTLRGPMFLCTRLQSDMTTWRLWTERLGDPCSCAPACRVTWQREVYELNA